MSLENIQIRLIEENDYYKGVLELIDYFTKAENIEKKSFDKFQIQLKKINESSNFIYVMEYQNKIIASATLIVQYKFHNNFSKAALIEEVIISEEFRNQGLGKKLVEYLILQSKNLGCYKIILNSEEKNAEFYTKLGFIKYGIEFKMYIK